MALWVVRAGQEGTEEPVALRHGVAVIGWSELPDLAAVQTRNELRDLLRETYPDSSPGTMGQVLRQIGDFRSEIREGDLVALPLKSEPDKLAIGRVTGPYRYRPDLPPAACHTHPVEWIGSRIARAALGRDLLDSINVPPTVSRVGAPGAEERIVAILAGEPDPGTDAVESAVSLDRTSEEYARSVLVSLYPEAEKRREVLQMLAASIKHAHQVGPQSWELT